MLGTNRVATEMSWHGPLTLLVKGLGNCLVMKGTVRLLLFISLSISINIYLVISGAYLVHFNSFRYTHFKQMWILWRFIEVFRNDFAAFCMLSKLQDPRPLKSEIEGIICITPLDYSGRKRVPPKKVKKDFKSAYIEDIIQRWLQNKSTQP